MRFWDLDVLYNIVRSCRRDGHNLALKDSGMCTLPITSQRVSLTLGLDEKKYYEVKDVKFDPNRYFNMIHLIYTVYELN